MQALHRTWTVFVLTAKRLLSQGWLALATALGLTIAMALVLSVPLYADAVYYRMLQEELSGGASADGPARPLFAFMFRYAGSSASPVEWEDIQALDAYLHGSAGADLGLPQKSIVQYVQTERFGLFPSQDSAYVDASNPLAWTRFAFASDLQSRVSILDGRFPAVAPPTSDGTIEVLVSALFAQELGLEVAQESATSPAVISIEFFDLCFIGSVGFDDHLTDSSFASILFTSAKFEGGCSSGAYQQIVKRG